MRMHIPSNSNAEKYLFDSSSGGSERSRDPNKSFQEGLRNDLIMQIIANRSNL